MFKHNAKIASFGGNLLKLSHESSTTGTLMDVNVYLPKQYHSAAKIPVILYLSGLTCTPNNVSEKANWQLQADKYGFAMVFPDTSPRGADVATDPENSWDFGLGAGFYVNATEPQYRHYQMYDYVHQELQLKLAEEFTGLDFTNVGITGHSMGGYGALAGFFKNPSKYKSVSAFSPIVNPSVVPWGLKAFAGYLGDDKSKWAEYDPCELIKKSCGPGQDILIHQGSADGFGETQLKGETFVEAAKGTPFENHIKYNLVQGFDHSYYFVASFVPEHAEFHAKFLGL